MALFGVSTDPRPTTPKLAGKFAPTFISQLRNREDAAAKPRPRSGVLLFRRGTEGSQMMSEPRSFAYSLSRAENGWRWSVFDTDGVTVAGGADPSRDVAQAAVERMLQMGSGSGDSVAA
jgi:hypothetical protein